MIRLVVAIVLVLALIGCGTSDAVAEDATFTIRVVADPSYGQFKGSILLINRAGQSISQSVEGWGSKDYVVTGRSVSASFQNQQDWGILTLRILKGNDLVANTQTSARYGTVSASAR